MRAVYVFFVIFGCLIPLFDGAKILVIFHVPMRSHYNLGSALAKGLGNRGHEVKLLTPFNFTDNKIKHVYIDGMHEVMMEYQDAMQSIFNSSLLDIFVKFDGLTERLSEAALESSAMKNLLTSNESFDLIIFEEIFNEAMFGVADHFKAPFAVLGTVGSMVTNHLNGNLAPFSFVPNHMSYFRDTMTFFERLANAVLGIFYNLALNYKIIKNQESMYRKYFKDGSDFYELYKNVSLILINSNVCLETPRPYLPNMIPVGGFHINEPNKLPKDLQTYLDSAKEGIILFSFGSNYKSADMPKDKLKIIMATFKNLPQKIIWKYEDEHLAGKPDNVFIRKWLPQNDILAHPNVKLFISHGGMLSSTEALFKGVPIIGIPFYGDQKQNTLNIVSGGYGLEVDFKTLQEESFTKTINEILINPKYRENARKKSAIIKDQPLKPLDNAIFWLEHIIRHKGGNHLRSVASDISYVQYLLLDILAFISFITIILMIGTVLLCKVLFSKCKQYFKNTKDKKTKRE